MSILVTVVNQRMVFSTGFCGAVSGSQEFVQFRFDLGEEWTGVRAFAQFRQNGKAYNQYLDENKCAYLPAEIEPGECAMSLYGTGNEFTVATVNSLTFRVEECETVADAHSTKVSQSLYEQLVEMVNAVTDFDGVGLGDFIALVQSLQGQWEEIKSLANEAEMAATAAKVTANAAQTKANKAAADAESADKNAAEALSSATAAENNASEALSSAMAAQEDAKRAKEDAAQALSSAETAAEEARTAGADATAAQSSAEAAERSAKEAERLTGEAQALANEMQSTAKSLEERMTALEALTPGGDIEALESVLEERLTTTFNVRIEEAVSGAAQELEERLGNTFAKPGEVFPLHEHISPENETALDTVTAVGVHPFSGAQIGINSTSEIYSDGVLLVYALGSAAVIQVLLGVGQNNQYHSIYWRVVPVGDSVGFTKTQFLPVYKNTGDS